MGGFALPAMVVKAVGAVGNVVGNLHSHLLDLNIPVCFIRRGASPCVLFPNQKAFHQAIPGQRFQHLQFWQVFPIVILTHQDLFLDGLPWLFF